MINFGLALTVVDLVDKYKTAIDDFLEKPTKARRNQLIDNHHKLDYIATGLSTSMTDALGSIMILQQMNKQLRHHKEALRENLDDVLVVLNHISDGFKEADRILREK